MKSLFVSLAIVLLLTVAATKPVKGFDCEKAKVSLGQCVPFFTTNVNSPSIGCCKAMSDLKASTPQPECHATCDYLVGAAKGLSNLNIDKVVQLPKLCNVDIGFPIPEFFFLCMSCSSYIHVNSPY